MAGLVQGDRGDDRDLVLRSSTSLPARAFSAEIRIIQLDLSPQNVGLLPLTHRPQNLVVHEPGGVVIDAQMPAKLQERNPSLGRADQVKRQKPSGVRQFGRLHDRAVCECGLMPAGSALITLVPPSIDQATLLFVATGTAEAIRPAGLLQGGLALLLAAVKPLELNQREALLELDTVAGHRKTSTSVPL